MSEREPLKRKNLPDVVAEEVRAKISSGEYTGRLPASGKLAINHGVSRPTVLNALKLLASDNEITVRQGSGAFVAGKPPIRRRYPETPSTYMKVPDEEIPQEPKRSEPMSFHNIYAGLRLYNWTKQRLEEIEYTQSPSKKNLQRLEEAAGRVVLLDKMAEGVNVEPKNPLLKVAMINTFRPDIQTIQSFPTLGDALVALGESGHKTSR